LCISINNFLYRKSRYIGSMRKFNFLYSDVLLSSWIRIDGVIIKLPLVLWGARGISGFSNSQSFCKRLYAAASGIASHLFVFIHGERHTQGLRILGGLFVSTLIASIYFNQSRRLSVKEAVALSSLLIATYVVAIWTSMAIYRIFFHRLNKFPGPFLAKVTKLYHALYLDSKLRNCDEIKKLHEEYGDIVRIGKRR